jgi:hypothetical protein
MFQYPLPNLKAPKVSSHIRPMLFQMPVLRSQFDWPAGVTLCWHLLNTPSTVQLLWHLHLIIILRPNCLCGILLWTIRSLIPPSVSTKKKDRDDYRGTNYNKTTDDAPDNRTEVVW